MKNQGKIREPLTAIQLTREEMEKMEEGVRCSAGLMCLGLMIGNLPAHVGWYLEANEDGYDVARYSYGWTFQADPDHGIYCEDCTIQIEEMDREFRGQS